MPTEDDLRPSISLERRLDGLFANAARRAFGEVAFEANTRPSKHADYQVNGALALAKHLGKSPRQVAEELLAATDGSETERMLSATEIAGPGFINCTFSPDYLNSVIAELA